MKKDDFLIVQVNGKSVTTQLNVDEGLAVAISLHARVTRDETAGDPEAALDRIIETIRIENSALWEDSDSDGGSDQDDDEDDYDESDDNSLEIEDDDED